MKLKLIGFIAISCLLACCLFIGQVHSADKVAHTDKFVGHYSRNWMGPRLSIVPDGKYYRLKGSQLYESYKFVKISDFKLKDEAGVLGTLTLGDMVFEGNQKNKITVLKASFCYEWFLLIKEDASSKNRTAR